MVNVLTSAVALAVSAISLTSAQTFTSCDPTKVSTCKNDPGLKQKSYTVDFTKGVPSDWTIRGEHSIDPVNGVVLPISKVGDGPLLESNWYIFGGSVTCSVQCAKGKGVVSAFILIGDTLDELDWEIIGVETNIAQTNWFGKGNTTTYDRGTREAVSNPQGSFHDYTFTYDKQTISFGVDGRTLHSVDYNDPKAIKGTNFPQTPMVIRMGPWVAGSPGNNPGTVGWAGGYFDGVGAPYTMMVKSCTVTNDNPADFYTYGDLSGSWDSIKITNNSPPSNGNTNPNSNTNTNTPTNPSSAPTVAPPSTPASVPASAPPAGSPTQHPSSVLNPPSAPPSSIAASSVAPPLVAPLAPSSIPPSAPSSPVSSAPSSPQNVGNGANPPNNTGNEANPPSNTGNGASTPSNTGNGASPPQNVGSGGSPSDVGSGGNNPSIPSNVGGSPPPAGPSNVPGSSPGPGPGSNPSPGSSHGPGSDSGPGFGPGSDAGPDAGPESQPSPPPSPLLDNQESSQCTVQATSDCTFTSTVYASSPIASNIASILNSNSSENPNSPPADTLASSVYIFSAPTAINTLINDLLSVSTPSTLSSIISQPISISNSTETNTQAAAILTAPLPPASPTPTISYRPITYNTNAASALTQNILASGFGFVVALAAALL